MPTKVFWVEPSGDVQLYLRRYTSSTKHTCAKTGHYCNAMVPHMRVQAVRDADGYYHEMTYLKPANSDPNWPVACEACGRAFDEEDARQLFSDTFYKDQQGNEYLLRNLPPGACYDAWWYDRYCVGPDGRHLIVVLPNGREWCIDARASNCTLPNDDKHKCWVRHGKPEDGTLHVDKNGHTCQAGAGSIAVPGYHGFLHNGFLTDNM